MSNHPSASSVLVVGAGIIGLTAAWRLAELGHPVTLVDPALGSRHSHPAGGSQAALGVLMARVFHRSSGRAWRLRQHSHALWAEWLAELERRGHRLPRRQGLLLLAATADDLDRQERLAADRARLALPLRRLSRAELDALHPALPDQALGGLLSPEDGQLDPTPLLAALLQEARRAGTTCVADAAVAVEPGPRWRLRLNGGGALAADWVVLAAGLATAPLLASLARPLALQPVLGQALELELASTPDWNWPGAVVWRGVNLVPRPDLGGQGRRLWLGATLEPGALASPTALAELRHLGGEAPAWLRQARVVRQWHGLRCRPAQQAAPVLEEPQPHLLVASGHYRNGVLLAAATAAWLCDRIHGPMPLAPTHSIPPAAGDHPSPG
ncbi:MAG: FAD-dependent oxidoreductase [Cyanobacteriota bacterium]|nr:FAD-dependent oxidoreductase [Cyanobacteriota bacterium]